MPAATKNPALRPTKSHLLPTRGSYPSRPELSGAVPVRRCARGVRREVEADAERDDHPAEPGDAVKRPPDDDVHQERPRREEHPEERPDPRRERRVDP